jgi:hypothetical protein
MNLMPGSNISIKVCDVRERLLLSVRDDAEAWNIVFSCGPRLCD